MTFTLFLNLNFIAKAGEKTNKIVEPADIGIDHLTPATWYGVSSIEAVAVESLIPNKFFDGLGRMELAETTSPSAIILHEN